MFVLWFFACLFKVQWSFPLCKGKYRIVSTVLESDQHIKIHNNSRNNLVLPYIQWPSCNEELAWHVGQFSELSSDCITFHYGRSFLDQVKSSVLKTGSRLKAEAFKSMKYSSWRSFILHSANHAAFFTNSGQYLWLYLQRMQKWHLN